jgi:hypothetical protein
MPAVNDMRLKLPAITTLDRVLGLRSWGLILYGSLPACLSLLGLLDIKLDLIDRPVLIAFVSLLPLSVTFLLVRARERTWYFTDDYLEIRSLITTILIILCATAISGAVGIIRHKYIFSLEHLTDRTHMIALTESFLFAIASLVVSSTLFATVLTKDIDLPGLPSSGFVTAVAKIRQQLIAIQNSKVWQEYKESEGTKIFDELDTDREQLIKDLQVAQSQPGNKLAKRSLGLKPLETDIMVFAQSITYIKDGVVPKTILFRWQTYFADFNSLDDDTLERIKNERAIEIAKARYDVLQRIKSLRLGG